MAGIPFLAGTICMGPPVGRDRCFPTTEDLCRLVNLAECIEIGHCRLLLLLLTKE